MAGQNPTFDAKAYVDAAAVAVGLTLPEACRPGTVENVARTHAFALLLDFAPAENLDPAPVFGPLRGPDE